MSLKKRWIKRSLAVLLRREMDGASSALPLEAGNDLCSQDLACQLNRVMASHAQCQSRLTRSPELRARVLAVQQWQKQRVLRTYHRFLDHKALGQATRFVLEDAYAGPEHDALISEIERVAPYLTRVFPAPLVQVACDILTLNVLTLELDIALAETWLNQAFAVNTTALMTPLYEDIFCEVGQFERRYDQLDLVQKLGDSIERYLGSQWVYAAFKVAQFPAKAAGLVSLVDFMGRGFEAINALPIPGNELVSIITESELRFLERLAQGERGVFGATTQTDQACEALMTRMHSAAPPCKSLQANKPYVA